MLRGAGAEEETLGRASLSLQEPIIDSFFILMPEILQTIFSVIILNSSVNYL